jgi:hypothetical protein
MGWPSTLGLGRGLKTHHKKNQHITECYTGPQAQDRDQWWAPVNTIMNLPVL